MTELDGDSDPSDLPLDFYPPLSSAPHFLVPTQPTLLHPRTGQAAGAGSSARPRSTRTETHGTRLNEKQIWQAIKENVIEMSGDSGWGKVGSSLGGECKKGRMGARVTCRGARGRSSRSCPAPSTSGRLLRPCRQSMIIRYAEFLHRLCFLRFFPTPCTTASQVLLAHDFALHPSRRTRPLPTRLVCLDLSVSHSNDHLCRPRHGTRDRARRLLLGHGQETAATGDQV